MLSGFNNILKYKGNIYHIQTEDRGLKNPVISTVVFREGKVIASKQTSYADIIKFEKLEIVLKSLMKEQHMLVLKMLQAKFNDKGDGIKDK